jgi:hypothetical protein
MWAVPVLALLPFSVTFAEMYKCEEDGKTVFQDRPCRGSGAAITVQPASGKAPDVATEGQDSMSRLRANVNEMAVERRKREIAYQIQRLEGDIEGYRRAQDVELARLGNMKALAKNNLAGATWEQSISTEMQAVTEKYRTLTQTARDRISQLRQDADVIAKSK